MRNQNPYEEEEEIKSQATRINTLFKKEKALIGSMKKAANFKEPALILMRNNRKAELYENATTGKFEYTHSNGEDMNLTLDRHFLITIPYGQKEILTYICHEDYPFPMPHNALITAEMMKIAMEKILNDYRKWTAEEFKAKGDMWWKIGAAIAVCIIAYALYKMFTGNEPTTVAQETVTAVKVINETVKNVTILG